MGEIMFRGNIVMKGYLKNPAGHRQGLRRRLVPHRRPGGDGARPLREDQGPQQGHHHQRRREHQLSIEVEDALYRHPAVLACAVVARPDPKWGETPVAYVETKPDHP
jgi:fatty-acyl-CoA synthase